MDSARRLVTLLIVSLLPTLSVAETERGRNSLDDDPGARKDGEPFDVRRLVDEAEARLEAKLLHELADGGAHFSSYRKTTPQ